MSYTIEKPPDEPIVVTTLHADFSTADEGAGCLLNTSRENGG